jgi:hypothetical protein
MVSGGGDRILFRRRLVVDVLCERRYAPKHINCGAGRDKSNSWQVSAVVAGVVINTDHSPHLYSVAITLLQCIDVRRLHNFAHTQVNELGYSASFTSCAFLAGSAVRYGPHANNIVRSAAYRDSTAGFGHCQIPCRPKPGRPERRPYMHGSSLSSICSKGIVGSDLLPMDNSKFSRVQLAGVFISETIVNRL